MSATRPTGQPVQQPVPQALSPAAIKVLHVVGDSKFGGGAIIIVQLAEMARALGCHVDVLTNDAAFQGLLARHGIGVVDLPCIWRSIRPWRDLGGLWRLYRFLRRHRYALVHTHTSKAGVVGRLAARLAGTPVILHTVHGFAFHERTHPALIRAAALIEWLAGHWCHRIVTVAEFHRRWALKLGIAGPDKLLAIPNGIAEDRVASAAGAARLRASLGAGETDFLILSTGRLAAGKGIELLLEAVPLLAQRLGRPFQVLLAGDGPVRAQLEEMAARLGVLARVRFLGFRTDIGDLLAAADVVALPTVREGLSIALLEAMAAGKPILTTTIGSNAEATRNGEGALLIPPEDLPALVDGLCWLDTDSRLAARLAARARALFLESYTSERMQARYREEYIKLLGIAEKPRAQVA